MAATRYQRVGAALLRTRAAGTYARPQAHPHVEQLALFDPAGLVARRRRPATSTTRVLAGQLDLLALLDANQPATAPAANGRPCLYASPARGLAARTAEIQAWRAEYGNANSNRDSHAWRVNITCPDTPTHRCQPTVLSADLRCDCLDECFCVGDLLYRGACRGCDWEGEPVDGENPAAEDACDHAWPGWRQLPVVARMPEDGKRHDAWAKRVAATYPTGWLAGGGPIRTQRSGVGTRHVPGRTPFGGYDMAIVTADAEVPRTEAYRPVVRAARSHAARRPPTAEPDVAATAHPDGPGRVAPGQRVTCLPGSLPARDGGRGGGVLVSIGPKTSLVNVYGDRPRRIRNQLLHPAAGPWIAADRDARGLRTTTADGRGWLPGWSWLGWTVAQHLEYQRGQRQLPTPPPAPHRLVIIACGARKADCFEAPAGQMYTGSYHRAARRAADSIAGPGTRIMILSARYGLLDLDDRILRYETRLRSRWAITAAGLREQAEQLGVLDTADVTILAPAAYATLALHVWPHAYSVLAGTRGIGDQIRFAALATGTATVARLTGEPPAELPPHEAHPRSADEQPARRGPAHVPTRADRRTPEVLPRGAGPGGRVRLHWSGGRVQPTIGRRIPHRVPARGRGPPDRSHGAAAGHRCRAGLSTSCPQAPSLSTDPRSRVAPGCGGRHGGQRCRRGHSRSRPAAPVGRWGRERSSATGAPSVPVRPGLRAGHHGAANDPSARPGVAGTVAAGDRAGAVPMAAFTGPGTRDRGALPRAGVPAS